MAPLPPTTKRPTPTLSSISKTTHKAPTSKRSKRISKHATLLSRITKSAPQKSKIPLKRRRPSKKLVTNLDSLADALPRPIPHTAADDEAWEGIVDGNEDGGVKIKHKTLQSRPGAGKKKEALVAMERERFARNLAEMAVGSAQNATVDGRMVVGRGTDGEGTRGGSAKRWAAIRGFISQTMERWPEEGGAVVGKKK